MTPVALLVLYAFVPWASCLRPSSDAFVVEQAAVEEEPHACGGNVCIRATSDHRINQGRFLMLPSEDSVETQAWKQVLNLCRQGML